ncbi:uncharacterized protein LOC133777474 [Humulus lupulus]|uniref:uncharacterized protein LOC133777474 n=1 Tax=Humulus lupulus TaxID=3486 RepID=UPI002B4015C5|nr:uncharacterized protein LOC133777474 [Humulus lupulus]
MVDDYSFSISYQKALRAREKAIENVRCCPQDSYSEISAILYMMQKRNPRTVVDIVTDEDRRFKYLFFAVGASIKGWQHCTPLLVTDGTFLKNPHGGTLLIASAQNANRHIFPLAFAVVDSKNDESWDWFFHKLKESYGERQGQCIISDRHENLDNIDEKIRPCLFNEVGVEKWTRLYNNNKRYSTMTSNIAEFVNVAIKEIRELLIATLLKCLHSLVGTTNLLIFTVHDVTKSYIVDLEKRTCTCQKFQYDEMPYSHVMAALTKTHLSSDDYCSYYYTKEAFIVAYEDTILPFGDANSWDILNEMKQIIVLPPKHKRPAGCPKAQRYKSALESKTKTQNKCGRCKQKGHNRQTCKNEPVLKKKKNK